MAKRKRKTQVTRTLSHFGASRMYSLTLGNVDIFATFSTRSKTWGVLISLGGWSNATHYGKGRSSSRLEAYKIARLDLTPAALLVEPDDDPPVLRQVARPRPIRYNKAVQSHAAFRPKAPCPNRCDWTQRETWTWRFWYVEVSV